MGMLKTLKTLRKIRSRARRMADVASTCAMALGLGVTTLAFASVYGGPGIDAGVGAAAGGINGVVDSSVSQTILNIIDVAYAYSGILALAVIVIAAFYLILGLGDDGSKETAKKIILYTAVGLIILALAHELVDFFIGLPQGRASGALRSAIRSMLDVVTSYAGLIAVVVIVIAGFYLLLGLGDDGSKETAKKIVLYTAIGLILIAVANALVSFFQGLPTGADSAQLRRVVIGILFSVLRFVGLIAVVVIVIAGIMLVVSGGDEGQKDKARKIVLYAVIGLIVIALASLIVRFVEDLVT